MDYSAGKHLVPDRGAVVALLGAVVAAVYFLRPENRSALLRDMMEKLDAHVNFERYIIPVTFEIPVRVSVLFAFLTGVDDDCSGSIMAGLLMIVLGPHRRARRLRADHDACFRCRTGIKETNRLLRAGAASRGSIPQQHMRPMHPQAGDDAQIRHYPGGYDPLQ